MIQRVVVRPIWPRFCQCQNRLSDPLVFILGNFNYLNVPFRTFREFCAFRQYVHAILYCPLMLMIPLFLQRERDTPVFK